MTCLPREEAPGKRVVEGRAEGEGDAESQSFGGGDQSDGSDGNGMGIEAMWR